MTRTTTLAAVLLLTLASPALAGPASSLSWPSGAKSNLACLAQLRGRAIDAEHIHLGLDGATWTDQVTAAQGWVSSNIVTGPPITVVSPWLLTSGTKGDFAGCAAGAYDTYWRQFGTAWSAAASRYNANHPGAAAKKIIIEPGWEANLGSGSHPWGVDDISQIGDYKSCFSHAAAALRSTFPGVSISWTSAKKYTKNYTVAQMDPGVQDSYGLMYYDNYYNASPAPKLPITQATWDKYVNSLSGTGGSPSGIGSWLSYAKSHGKKMGVSEWGLWDTASVTTPQADDPVYIDNMYRFFKANAASITHETYQNNNTSDTDGHELCPATTFPQSRAKYAADWKAG